MHAASGHDFVQEGSGQVFEGQVQVVVVLMFRQGYAGASVIAAFLAAAFLSVAFVFAQEPVPLFGKVPLFQHEAQQAEQAGSGVASAVQSPFPFPANSSGSSGPSAVSASQQAQSGEFFFRSGERPQFSFSRPVQRRGFLPLFLKDRGVQSGVWRGSSEYLRATVSYMDNSSFDAFIEESRDGSFNITVPVGSSFRPGRYRLRTEYSLSGAVFSSEQDFTWGVLAINTDKAAYLGNDSVFFSFAVLDDFGRVDCDADLFLDVVSPNSTDTLSTSGGTILRSPDCAFLGVAELPDYFAYYNVTSQGRHELRLWVVARNGQRYLYDSFMAYDSVDFDVQRVAATRIYPKVRYPVEIHVRPSQDYRGDVVESVPSVFGITPQQGLSVTEAGDTKFLRWQADVPAGSEAVFRYEYDAPDVSPYLYLSGPLVLGSFSEARRWMIASDSVNAIGYLGTGYAVFTNGSSNSTPFLKYFDGSFPFSSGSLQSVDEAVKWAVIRASPVRDERLLVFADNGSDINVVVCNPNCGSPFELTTSMTGSDWRGFDAAYEQVSGDAMVVFSDGTALPKYIKWDGANWGASSALPTDTCAGLNRWVTLSSQPGSNELFAGLLDAASDLCTQVWNGSEWVNHTKIIGTVEVPTSQAFDIAYEYGTGKAFIVFAEATTGGPVYNRWNGSGLDFPTNQNGPSTDAASIVNIRLASEPGSNRILYGGTDTGQDDLNVLQWNGTDWGARPGGTDYDGSINAVSSQRIFDVGYLGDSGRGAVFYRDANDGFVNFGTCSSDANCQAGTWSAAGTACPGSTNTSTIPNWVSIASSASSASIGELLVVTISQVVASVSDGSGNVFAHRYDGASCESTHLGNVSTSTTESAMFAYSNNPSQLPLYYLHMLRIPWGITDARENTNLTMSSFRPLSRVGEVSVPVPVTASQWSAGTCFYLYPRLNLSVYGIDRANLTVWLRSASASVSTVNFSFAELLGNGTLDFYAQNLTDGVSVGASYTKISLMGPEVHSEKLISNSTLRACIAFNPDITTTIDVVLDNYTFNSSMDFNYSLSDVFPPVWSSNLSNESSEHPKVGGVIQLNVTLSDNDNLGAYIYSTNDSGSWVNATVYLSGRNRTIIINETVDTVGSRQVGWQFFFNDSVNNTNSTPVFVYSVKNTAPSFIQSLQNQSALSNQSFFYDVNCSDNDIEDVSYYDNSTLFDINPANGQISFSPAEVYEGVHVINISCGDALVNVSMQFNLTVSDVSPPGVLLWIGDIANVSSGNVSFNFTGVDGKGLANASLFANFSGSWQRNFSNQSLLQNGTFSLINVSLQDGSYLWNVELCDIALISNCAFNSTNRTVFIDTFSPNSSAFLLAEAGLYNGTLLVNVSVNDTVSGAESLYLRYENSSVNGSWVALNLSSGSRHSGFWNASIYTPSIADGHYNLTINSTDFAGNRNVSRLHVVFDNVAPQWYNASRNISLVFNGDIVNFSAAWNDSVGLSGFVFSVNQSGVWLNSSFVQFSGFSNTSYSLAAITAEPATNVSWRFFARDISGWWNSSDVLSFVVADVVPPVVVINAPVQDANLSLWNLSFNFTLTDFSPLLNATLWSNFSGQWARNNSNETPLTNGESYLINVTEIPEGVFIWNIESCDDSVLGFNCGFNSTNYTLSIDRSIPMWSNNVTNETVDHPKQGGVVQLNVSLSDNHRLFSFIYSTNDSGLWINETFFIGGNNFTIVMNESVDSPVGRDVGWQVFFNDTAGNRNYTALFAYTVRAGGGDTGAPTVILNQPVNGRRISAVNISFNFTATDPSGIENATLWSNITGVWAANTTNQTDISSGVLATINMSGLSDGVYVWNVQACDRAFSPNCGFSVSNLTFVVDTVSPLFSGNVTFPLSPSNYSNTTNYSFNVSWSDSEIDSVLMENNFTGALLNYSVAVQGSTYFYTVVGLKAGLYSWRHYANDTAGNVNSTPVLFFNVTRAKSIAELYINGSRAGRNFEVFDMANFSVKLNAYGKMVNLSSNMSLYYNSTANLTNLTQLSELGSFMINGSFEGDENTTDSFESWVINVLDSRRPNSSGAGINSTAVYQFDYLMFNASWSDNFNLSHFIFSVNQSGVWVNSTAIAFQGVFNVSFNITQVIAPDGTNVAWRFFANDSSGNFNETPELSFTVADNDAPNVSLVLPAEASNLSQVDVNFTFIPSDNIGFRNATLWINMTGVWVGNSSNQSLMLNGTQNNFTLDFVPEGSYLWNVEVFDLYNLSNSSSRNYSFAVDRTFPNITLDYPINSSFLGYSFVELNFTVVESAVLNCSLYSDFSAQWAINQTLNRSASNVTSNFSKVSLRNGTFLWSVECYDYAGNRNFSSNNFSFTVDTAAPAVNLTLPVNNTNQKDTSSIVFTYNVTDANPVGNCSLVVNDIIDQTDGSVLVNTSLSFSKSFDNGDYNWSVNCTDAAGNTGASEVRNLTIAVPLPEPNALVAYFSNNDSAPLLPKFRAGNGTVWVEEGNASNISSTAQWVVLRAAPSREEWLMGTLDSAGKVYAQVFDGVAWGNASLMTSAVGAANSRYRGFDVAYERNSSTAMIVYNVNTGTPSYRLWNGSGWFSEGSLDADGCVGVPVWIVLASNPLKNEVLEVDLDTSGDFCAQVWNGSEWSSAKTLSTAGQSFSSKMFDAAYEQGTGAAMVAWESSVAGIISTINFSSSSPTSGTWNTSTTNFADFGSSNVYIRMASMRNSRRIMLGSVEAAAANSYDINVVEWNGAGWGTAAALDTAVASMGDGALDVAYIGITGDALAVYNDFAAPTTNRPAFRSCTGSANCFAGTWNAASFTAPAGSNCGLPEDLDFIHLDADPNSNRVLLVAQSFSNHTKCSQEYSGGWQVWVSNLGNGSVQLNSSGIMGQYARHPLDTVAPEVSLNSPAAGQSLNLTNVSFNFTALDNYRTRNATLYTNFTGVWEFNNSIFFLVNNDSNLVVANDAPEGIFVWNVLVTDTSKNRQFSSSNRTVVIDRTAPLVILNLPGDLVNTTNTSLQFNWSVIDLTSAVCNISVDGVVNSTGIITTNGTVNVTLDGISKGNHLWNVSCADNASNSNLSASRRFTVVGGPSNISVFVSGRNVTLSWSNETYADSYSIFISDNFSAGFAQVPNVSGITDTNWTDISAFGSRARFYRVSAVRSGSNQSAVLTAGAYGLSLVAGWNFISVPFNLSVYELYNGSNSGFDFATDSRCSRSLWRFNATQGFERSDYNGSAWIPASGSENFTFLERGKGYWLETNESCNVTFFGTVPVSNLTMGLVKDWNIVSWHSVDNKSLETDYGAPLIVHTPANSLQAIDRFNPASGLFEVTVFYMDGSNPWGWFPSWNNQDFTQMEPGRAYYFDAGRALNWTHTP
ncbi:hypothetical protein HY640_00395 [Candidatus Woesearchaeota archaeon]|nr:hypothetical protein [Candidatus Woesearchaeota archaeon]